MKFDIGKVFGFFFGAAYGFFRDIKGQDPFCQAGKKSVSLPLPAVMSTTVSSFLMRGFRYLWTKVLLFIVFSLPGIVFAHQLVDIVEYGRLV